VKQGGGAKVFDTLKSSALDIEVPDTSSGHLVGTPLRALDDAEVANCARAEGSKRLAICLALVRCEGDRVALELDQHHPLPESGFRGLHLTRRLGQEAPAE